MNIRIATLMLAGATALFAFSPAMAEAVSYKVEMTGKQEVPPNDSAGKGTADVSFDSASKKLTWKVTSEGLSGDVTAAHFHGPAKPGANAPPVVDLTGKLQEGSADLTDEQVKQLEAGEWYINLHTAKFPDGEIRGQLEKAN